MAFRLTSSNGPATHLSFTAARTADIAFAGALTWTVDQAGDGGGVNTSGMAFSSLLITVAAAIRHTGIKVANLALVGHTTGQIFVNRANVIIEWMTFAGEVGGGVIFQAGCGTAGILRNFVGQCDGLAVSFSEVQNDNNATPISALFENGALYGGYNIECDAIASSTASVSATATFRHISNSGASSLHTYAAAPAGKTATATLDAINCVSIVGFTEIRAGEGGTEHSICNTTNCTYAAGGRSVAGVEVIEGTDTQPTANSTVDIEFASSTDCYSAKTGARRNRNGTATATILDVLGVAYTNPPNVGFSALPVTKLYLSVDVVISGEGNPPAEQSSNTADKTWSGAESAIGMSTTIGTLQNTVSTTTLASASAQRHFIGLFVTEPLNVEQVVGGGTATFNIADRENSLNANFVINMPVVYVWSPRTQSVVGFLADPTSSVGGSEATAINQYQVTHFTFSTNAVKARAGDIIVLELWALFTQVDAVARTVLYAYSGTVENSTENAVVTDHASYLQLAEDLTFGTLMGPLQRKLQGRVPLG